MEINTAHYSVGAPYKNDTLFVLKLSSSSKLLARWTGYLRSVCNPRSSPLSKAFCCRTWVPGALVRIYLMQAEIRMNILAKGWIMLGLCVPSVPWGTYAIPHPWHLALLVTSRGWIAQKFHLLQFSFPHLRGVKVQFADKCITRIFKQRQTPLHLLVRACFTVSMLQNCCHVKNDFSNVGTCLSHCCRACAMCCHYFSIRLANYPG